MRLLLDTHIFIWLATGSDRLGAADRRLVESTESFCLLSAVSLWEIRIKWDSRDREGRRKGQLDPHVALALADRLAIKQVSLSPQTAVAALNVAVAHADPFDRMLLTQAQELNARLLTRDAKLRDHPLALFS